MFYKIVNPVSILLVGVIAVIVLSIIGTPFAIILGVGLMTTILASTI